MNKLFLGDCLNILPTLEAESVNLVFVDPPYNIGIFKKMPPDEYLAWCEQWIAECSRVLAPNGAFWVSHKNPRILGRLADMIECHGRKLINWVTWDKYNQAGTQQGFLDGYTVLGDLRSLQVMSEYLIYHADEGQWTTKCDRERGFIFEPLRAYLDSERKRANVNKAAINVACGFSASAGGMASRHYFSRSQWCLPTQEHYKAMQKLFNRGNGNEFLRREYEDLRREYEFLRREYEDLRREYEDLRYTFNNPGKVSSVWQIPPAAKVGNFPTPKPEALLERIINATSNPGDLVLDPTMGSGTTCAVADKLGRHYIGIEIEQKWYELAKGRIEQPMEQLKLV